MIERVQGLILRTRLLTETSLIIHWLTPEFGRLATVAKGARRPKSLFLGKLDLFYLADFSFQRSRSSELHTLREVSLRDVHARLRQEIGYVRQAAYCAALIEQTTETETPLPFVFKLMKNFLDHLSEKSPQPQTIFAFELKLLNELGLKPDLEKTKLKPGTQQLVKQLLKSDWSGLRRLKFSAAQTAELQQFLHGFLIFHLGKIPAGRHTAVAA